MVIPAMTFTFRWDASSTQWISGLKHRIDQALSSGVFQARARDALEQYAAKVRRFAPRSSSDPPHMGDDWQLLHIGRQAHIFGLFSEGRPFIYAVVGSRLSQPAYESNDQSTRFNIPWGIQDGFESHRVWLYLPEGVKTGPRIRRKLVQWALGPSAPVDDYEALVRYIREQRRPPWITVSGPPRPYIFGPNRQFLSELGEDLGTAVWQTIGELAWRAA